MNYDELISDLIIQNGAGEFVITDESMNIKGTVGSIGMSEARWHEEYRDRSPRTIPDDEITEWEIAEKDDAVYYRVHSSGMTQNGEHVLVHHVYDISDYAELFHDISVYSREWRALSSCQNSLIAALSDDATGCLGVALKYFESKRALLYIKRNRQVECHETDGGPITCGTPSVSGYEVIEHATGDICTLPDREGEYMCCASGTAYSDVSYALYTDAPDFDTSDKMYNMAYDVFKLYIENALLREKIVFESEHDHLTGLYNKGKYNEFHATLFTHCEVITVFSLDLNYLKRTNDTLGHEAGNRLLIMAADSLKAVSGDGVYAFRTGGDEFMMVATETDEAGAQKIIKSWREALDEINRANPGLECVIACGVVTGHKPYDMRNLFNESDQLMYEDKRAIKISRGDDPDGR